VWEEKKVKAINLKNSDQLSDHNKPFSHQTRTILGEIYENKHFPSLVSIWWEIKHYST